MTPHVGRASAIWQTSCSHGGGMRTRRDRPYWLRVGSAVCIACEGGFVIEAGFHCVACDRPLCGECALVDPATGEVVCLACRESEDGAG